MARIGSHRRNVGLWPLWLLLAAGPAWAEVELQQTVDRTTVGTEDTFRLTVVVSGAPESAQLQLPAPNDFEVLSRSQSTQMSYRLGGGGAGTINRVQKYLLVMRANRVGRLTIPPAVLTTANHTYRAEAIKMEVKRGHVQDPGGPRAQRPKSALPDPFQGFPMPGFPDDFEDPNPEPEIPRSDSDLFLKSTVDKEEMYVGEQATLSLFIYSRVDLSSVDAVTLPKLDGFWSEDLDSPTQLAGEQKVINGIPYRAYLLKRKAIFPVKPGTFSIGPAEADVTTGFLFAGHRVHRKGNGLTLKVKPLPPGGPVDLSSANVGQWRLSEEFSQTQVVLGEPVTIKVTLEGQGNVKNVALPKLSAPPSLKVYDPTTTDRVTVTRSSLGGKRVQEYLVMPQQTGSFTLPPLVFSYFDPEEGRYQTSKTDPVTLTVLPGAGGATALSAGQAARPGALEDSAQKNKLQAATLRPLRYQATFQAPSEPLWKKPFFVPVTLAPLALWGGLALVGMIRGAMSIEDPKAVRRRKTKVAQARLEAAVKLKQSGKPSEFYGEVEKALLHFLEAKLDVPVGGLTREGLAAQMATRGVPAERQQKILAVLETCDVGRFAPGGGNAPARGRVLDEAAEAMDAWDTP